MNDKHHVQSVVVANRLLGALAQESSAVPLAVLARMVGMTPTRVFRHLSTLVDLQLVERTGNEPLYRLGVGLVRLGQQAASQHDVSRLAYPALRQLNDEHGQATYLTRAQQDNAVVWLSFQSNDVPQLIMPPGMTLSLAGSACGRAMMAFTDDPPQVTDYPSVRSATHADPLPDAAALAQRLAAIRARFYDYFGVEDANAVYSLAAPILDHREQAVGAVGIVGFSVLFRERRTDLLSGLLSTCARISGDLGSKTGWPPAPQNPFPALD